MRFPNVILQRWRRPQDKPVELDFTLVRTRVRAIRERAPATDGPADIHSLIGMDEYALSAGPSPVIAERGPARLLPSQVPSLLSPAASSRERLDLLFED